MLWPPLRPHLDATDDSDRPSALARSADPLVQAYRNSGGAFLNGEGVESKIYEPHRVH